MSLLNINKLDFVLLCIAKLDALWEIPFTTEEKEHFTDVRGDYRQRPFLYGETFVRHLYDGEGNLYLSVPMKKGFEFWSICMQRLLP